MGSSAVMFAFIVFLCVGLAEASLGAREILLQKFPEESPRVIDAWLEQSAVAAGMSGCARDYSAVCPSGWGELEDGLTCVAPVQHLPTPDCPTKITMGALTPAEKESAAKSCGSEYMCLDAAAAPVRRPASIRTAAACSKVDYSALCPMGWSQRGPDCVAPWWYRGRCALQLPQISSQEGKQEVEELCDLSWPCAAA